MTESLRPVTLLIAALGGEGGGVLTNWIIGAAESLGFPAQSTSIPGVAQRTGATIYYVEILPVPSASLGGKRPILALSPGLGEVDVLLASELAETARAVSSGFVTPDRTKVIASTSRSYLMPEKTAMADGRLIGEELLRAVERHASASLILDMESLAKSSGSMVNAVMLGALAGSGALPIPAESFAQAIQSSGKAAESNLRGFEAGLRAAHAGTPAALRAPEKRWRETQPSLAQLESRAGFLPEEARHLAVEGVRRLADYQDLAYAKLYLDRLGPIEQADERSGLDGKLAASVARHLAVRMSFEDVIRVAQVKADPARIARIRRDLGAKPGDTLAIFEFFKPGIDELCSILPPLLARPILYVAEKRGWLGRAYWGMEIQTTSVLGYLRMKALASLRPWRRWSHRFREEQREISAWLSLVAEAAALSPALALEVAQCANLIKGYGDTHKRGMASYRAIVERVVRPALKRRLPAELASDAVASAYAAALADPEGESLARTLAAIEQRVQLDAAAE
ncbi:MAG TPA: indolepyruvate oxidoreductase subunit beta family protein [Stellaceae bacterium]|nr:indolepyruvate oxidoreductase subunit beta family protein [Stellaceae bacterium]